MCLHFIGSIISANRRGIDYKTASVLARARRSHATFAHVTSPDRDAKNCQASRVPCSLLDLVPRKS